MGEMPQSGVTDRKTRKVRQDYCHCLCLLITCSFLHFRPPFDGIGVGHWVIFVNFCQVGFQDWSLDWSGFRIHKHTRLIDPEWVLIFLLPGEAQCYVYLGLVKGLSLRAALVVAVFVLCPSKIFNISLRR